MGNADFEINSSKKMVVFMIIGKSDPIYEMEFLNNTGVNASTSSGYLVFKQPHYFAIDKYCVF